jgi:hypothetical protein
MGGYALMHFRTITIACTTCAKAPVGEMRYCYECKGVDYIEQRSVRCTGKETYDPMLGGWECSTCGGSGPL